MKNYIITVPEVHMVRYFIEADSEEEAIQGVKNGDGEPEPDEDVDYTYDVSTWDCEKLPD